MISFQKNRFQNPISFFEPSQVMFCLIGEHIMALQTRDGLSMQFVAWSLIQ